MLDQIRERASKWIDRYIRRNYGVKTRGLTRHLDPNPEVYVSLKQRIFRYMEDHPIARPKMIMRIFKEENSETIRHYVKEWKKQNKKIIIQHTIKLLSLYTKQMGLGQDIESKAGELLRQYIFREDPDLKMKWIGIIAGTIYLACRILKKSISQTDMGEFIGIDNHTISKRYRDIADSLSIEI